MWLISVGVCFFLCCLNICNKGKMCRILNFIERICWMGGVILMKLYFLIV